MPSSGVQTCALDRKSTRLNSSHTLISYAVFCLKKEQHALGLVGVDEGDGVRAWCGFLSVDVECLGPRPPLITYLFDVLMIVFFLKAPATPKISPFPSPGALPF